MHVAADGDDVVVEGGSWVAGSLRGQRAASADSGDLPEPLAPPRGQPVLDKVEPEIVEHRSVRLVVGMRDRVDEVAVKSVPGIVEDDVAGFGRVALVPVELRSGDALTP